METVKDTRSTCNCTIAGDSLILDTGVILFGSFDIFNVAHAVLSGPILLSVAQVDFSGTLLHIVAFLLTHNGLHLLF